MPQTPRVADDSPPRRIRDVAAELGLDPDVILPHGHYIAKVPVDELARRGDQPDGKGAHAVVATHFANGGAGAIGLAEAVLQCVEQNRRRKLKFHGNLPTRLLLLCPEIHAGAEDCEHQPVMVQVIVRRIP